MITSFRKGRRSPFVHLLPWRKESVGQTIPENIFSEQQFQFELEKERSRVERRIDSTKFALLLLEVPSNETISAQLESELHKRLRITDCIGWCGQRLGVLLPETNRKGAGFVAASLSDIGLKHELEFCPEILIFPDDDLLASTSIEFAAKYYDDDQWPHDDTDANQASDTSEQYAKDTAAPVKKVSSANGAGFKTSLATPIWKRSVDIFGSLFGLLLLSPVFLLAGLAVWLTSPGPMFFRQLREGKDGKRFFIYKFRTMCNDAEALKNSLRHRSEQDGPAFKLEQDPRLTPIGKYLRRSCIDELPQLFNVLKGEMSLVGPRPLPVDESIECEVWQRSRLMVLPGITCVWQARGDRNTRFSDWMRMDVEYLRKRSFLFDLKIIMETICAVILHRGSV